MMMFHSIKIFQEHNVSNINSYCSHSTNEEYIFLLHMHVKNFSQLGDHEFYLNKVVQMLSLRSQKLRLAPVSYLKTQVVREVSFATNTCMC